MAPAATLSALLANLIDYAGLFPPASLSMEDTARAYHACRHSPHAWALGRLIIPASRLVELREACESLRIDSDTIWHISAILGDNRERDANAIASINSALGTRLIVDAAEFRVADRQDLGRTHELLAGTCTLYAEVTADELNLYADELSRLGMRAKIRTGGITPAAIPSAIEVARFLAACATIVPFKATAGLHHPFRSNNPLTYSENAPRSVMHGFLNVFVSAALAQQGASASDLAETLEERNPKAFSFTNTQIAWRHHSIPLAQVREVRQKFAISFGSCSFREPIDDLSNLGLL